MKASKVIMHLAGIIEEHGDFEVNIQKSYDEIGPVKSFVILKKNKTEDRIFISAFEGHPPLQ